MFLERVIREWFISFVDLVVYSALPVNSTFTVNLAYHPALVWRPRFQLVLEIAHINSALTNDSADTDRKVPLTCDRLSIMSVTARWSSLDMQLGVCGSWLNQRMELLLEMRIPAGLMPPTRGLSLQRTVSQLYVGQKPSTYIRS